MILSACQPSVERGNRQLAVHIPETSWSELRENSKSFHEHFVSLEGELHYQFEDVAIYEKGWFTKSKVWIDDLSILDDLDEGMLERNNKKDIKIVGIYNADDKGHIGQYNGALKSVIYIRID